MTRRKSNEMELRLDLHGMTLYEAKMYLTEQLDFLPPHITSVRIIHGYHGGQILSNLVRNQFYHYRIDEIIPVFANDGETIYYIKKEN